MKRITDLFLFLLFLLYSISSYAQNNINDSLKIDSLKKVLQTQKEDTSKVNTLIAISDGFLMKYDHKNGMQYANEALSLAKKINFKKGEGTAYDYISGAYYHKRNFPEARKNSFASLKIFEELRDTLNIGSSYYNIAIDYLVENNYPETLKYMYTALKFYEKAGNKQGIAKCLLTIGGTYFSQKNYSDALKNWLVCLKVHVELGDSSGISYLDYCLGNIYFEQGNYAEAMEKDSAALKISEKIGYKHVIGNAKANVGEIFEKQGEIAALAGDLAMSKNKFSEALKNYLACLEIFEKDDKYSIGEAYLHLGKIHIKLKNLSAAKKYLQKSLQLAKVLSYNYNIKNSYSSLAELDSLEGNYRLAYEHYKMYILYRDSLVNEENLKKSVQQQMQYEFDKKEAVAKAAQDEKDVLANAEINKQKLIRNTTLGGVGLAALFSFLLFRSYNRRKKTAFHRQVSEVEMKALRSQMNPHFIFNSLHSINKYMADNDKENASEYLSKFSKLMRLILENSREHEVPLQDDLSALELYMQLESLRFQNSFTYDIEVDPQIDKENTLIPPMLLQPFVENSIIHGMRTKENGIIKIKIQKEGNMMRCTVEDNGIGREQSVVIEREEEKKHGSLGMKITRERLEIINRLKKVKAAINIFDLKGEDNKPGGLRVELTLPFETAF